MNAIVALCHFCESHGPCILFCSQAFHQSQDAQLLLDSAPLESRRPVTRESDIASLESSLHSLPKSSDQCDACRSIPTDQPGYISYDSKAHITYISGQYPEQKQLYSILRQACVRSLNCEVCPGREGPIVFGEDNSCHTLSHTFKIHDSQARGFSRLYSIIVVMMDRVFLINSWPFLVRHFRVLIDNLQEKAKQVFTMESEEHKSIVSSVSLLSHYQGPDHLRRIRTNESGRSLVELTGDKDVFVYLHKYFVFLLKTGGRRMTECIVEGPAQTMVVPEPSRELSDTDLLSSLDKPVPAVDFRIVYIDNQPTFKSIRHLLKILGRDDFMELAYHIMRGDQLIVRGSDISTVMSVLNALKELIPESCCRIVGFSGEYKESYLCEFIGLAVGVNLPKHIVDSEIHVLLDILPPLKRYYSRSAGDQPSPLIDGMDPLEQYKLIVYSAQSRIEEQKYPLLIKRLMNLLSASGDTLSDMLLSRSILALKEEWMNKVKVLYKFSQVSSSNDKDERLAKLLKDVLFVPSEDLPILKHWRAALRKDYRTHLMQN